MLHNNRITQKKDDMHKTKNITDTNRQSMDRDRYCHCSRYYRRVLVSEAARGAWRAAAVLLLGSSMGKREERKKDNQTDQVPLNVDKNNNNSNL
jgi:hypothetical protein